MKRRWNRSCAIYSAARDDGESPTDSEDIAICHGRIRTIAPVIEVNSIKELISEVIKHIHIHSCSTGA
jgi:hypothetical protein